MCTGTSFMIAATIASSAMTAMGQMQQAKSQKAQANFNAAVARNNATISQQNAQDARDRGHQAEQEHRERVRLTKGTARAQQAANGFLVDDTADSTNVDLLSDIEAAGALDILKIRDNTEREARRAELQGSDFTAQALGLDLQASSINPTFAVAGTLLGGAAKAAGLHNKAQVGKAGTS